MSLKRGKRERKDFREVEGAQWPKQGKNEGGSAFQHAFSSRLFTSFPDVPPPNVSVPIFSLD